jgi:hypothetical protein
MWSALPRVGEVGSQPLDRNLVVENNLIDRA